MQFKICKIPPTISPFKVWLIHDGIHFLYIIIDIKNFYYLAINLLFYRVCGIFRIPKSTLHIAYYFVHLKGYPEWVKVVSKHTVLRWFIQYILYNFHEFLSLVTLHSWEKPADNCHFNFIHSSVLLEVM